MDNWAKIVIGDSRAMPEIEEKSVALVVTSPPYWQIKNYGVTGQIGYGQTLHQYLTDLFYTWSECFRILRPGSRLCINIGDQFARSAVYGRYKVIPLHAEFIAQCEKIGFDFLGSIIWQKKTTMNTTGGAVVMGSYPYPPNGLIEIDYEFILIFKKPGESKKVLKEMKEGSKLSKQEWKEYFYGHWYFGGAKQVGHEAMFPEELPRRLIRMFSFQGDAVLDPFLGSGTTVKAALEFGRNGLGYEINKDFLRIIEEKIGLKDKLPTFGPDLQIIERSQKLPELPVLDYTPAIQDAQPLIEPTVLKREALNRVVQIIGADRIKLDNGQTIGFLGVKINRKEETINYLTEHLLGKQVIIRNGSNSTEWEELLAYVYLKNKIFINSYLIKSGLGSPDLAVKHKFNKKFIKFSQDLTKVS
ncbi:MAG: site-specific DNA-methyltransferase [Deltaproteobacteria bacterium]|nr:site-specific DNA-methyltransferase [Deltaproteobacteria bacterium]